MPFPDRTTKAGIPAATTRLHVRPRLAPHAARSLWLFEIGGINVRHATAHLGRKIDQIHAKTILERMLNQIFLCKQVGGVDEIKIGKE